MSFKKPKSRFYLSFLVALATLSNPLLDYAVSAQVIQVAQLSSSQKNNLQQGKAVITGEKGEYTGQILVTGSVNKAWEVLTDYNNFENFLPNVASSELIESSGNRKVFEQVNVVRAFFVNTQARIRIASTENYPRSISFSLVEGDLKSLQGTWQIQQFSANQVLITQTVSVQPESSTPKDIFYSIYQDSLAKTLTAIKKEVEKRS